MSPKVLFVDDDESNLIVCEAVCGDEFDVLTASGGAEALELMRAHEVAVVVSDQRMPNMSGVELLEQVHLEFPDAARVLVTAYTDAHAAIDAINRGRVRRFLKKPWEPGELRAEIMDGLERYSTQRRIKELERRLIQTERVYALGIVAAGIGHELRNPISWIATNLAHSLTELGDLSRAIEARDIGHAAAKLDEIRAALQDANTGTERVIEIVSAIQFSMVRPTNENELVSLEEVVRLALRLVEGDLRRAGHVELDFGPRLRLSASELFEKCFSFKQAENARNRVCVTANWTSRLALIRSFGGFDATLKSGGDHRLAAQIAAAGHLIVYAPGAIVRHPARADFRELTRKRRRVIGGVFGTQCRAGRKSFPRFVGSLFKETLVRLHSVFTGAVLPHSDRVRVGGLLVVLCGVSVAEAFRLRLGGEPQR